MRDNIKATARELRNLKNERKILKAQLDDLDSKISQAEADLEEFMLNNGVEEFISDNAKFTLTTTLTTSIDKSRMPELCAAAQSNGCGDLIRTSINTNTLSAFVRRYANENGGLIPDWLDGYTTISARTKLKVIEI